jgi:hypothetical protein
MHSKPRNVANRRSEQKRGAFLSIVLRHNQHDGVLNEVGFVPFHYEGSSSLPDNDDELCKRYLESWLYALRVIDWDIFGPQRGAWTKGQTIYISIYLALNSFTKNSFTMIFSGRMEVQQRYSWPSLKMRAIFFLQQKWVYYVNVLPWVVGISAKQHPIRFCWCVIFHFVPSLIRCGSNTQRLVDVFLSFPGFLGDWQNITLLHG